ncbi:MAG TPA: DUF2914 domain-containing protein [Polyangiaceae bacterium]|nr:DUF2914 domain-containing protein [Polyangiaceae bacterium]
MDRSSRFAIYTAVGLAAFSASLSLTTACDHGAPARQERQATRSASVVSAGPPSSVQSAPAAPAPSTTARRLPAPTPAGSGLTLSVRRLVVTHAVSAREPVVPAALVLGTPVVAFLELVNADAAERKVTVTFEREGQLAVGHVTLAVPGRAARFRTWARTHNLAAPGTWETVVRADDGVELGRVPFEVPGALVTAS